MRVYLSSHVDEHKRVHTRRVFRDRMSLSASETVYYDDARLYTLFEKTNHSGKEKKEKKKGKKGEIERKSLNPNQIRLTCCNHIACKQKELSRTSMKT